MTYDPQAVATKEDMAMLMAKLDSISENLNGLNGLFFDLRKEFEMSSQRIIEYMRNYRKTSRAEIRRELGLND